MSPLVGSVVRRVSRWGAVLVLVAAACGGADDGMPDADAPDAGAVDAGAVDAAPDAATDAALDPDAAAADAAPDPDAAPDDAAPDAAPDAGPDPDAASDARPPPDSGPVVGTWTVDAIDVGTGLALLVRGPDFTLLYDGGSNDDLRRGADNRVLAYLRAAAPDLRVIDHLVLSHPHRDHVELLSDVIEAYDVREVWDSGALNDICGYRAFIQSVVAEPDVAYHTAAFEAGVHAIQFPSQSCYSDDLPARSIAVTHGAPIQRGVPVALGVDASMTFVHADGETHGGRYNENSLVVRLDLGDRRVLLAGDAEGGPRTSWPDGPVAGSVEAELVACCTAELRADVLVAGHHGSRTSSRTGFLDAVAPAISIVSSGPKLYGSVQLPDPEVVAELARRSQVFRTDVDDEACKTAASKIGPDRDNRVGGCSNIRVTLTSATATARYLELTD